MRIASKGLLQASLASLLQRTLTPRPCPTIAHCSGGVEPAASATMRTQVAQHQLLCCCFSKTTVTESVARVGSAPASAGSGRSEAVLVAPEALDVGAHHRK